MGLTTEGVIFMVTAWSIIFTITGYCFYKVYKSENSNNEK